MHSQSAIPENNRPSACVLAAVLTFVLMILSAPVSFASPGLDTLPVSSLLDTLDVTLSKSDDYEHRKLERIDRIRQQLNGATDREQRYWIARDLYGEYSTLDSDSALHYADMAYETGRELGRPDWMDEMQLNRAHILAATGLLVQADQILGEITPANLHAGLEARYFEQLLFLSTHRDQFYGLTYKDNPYSTEASAMLDSLCRSLSPAHSRYSWLKGWQNLQDSSSDASEVIDMLRKTLSNSRFDSQQDAMDAWILSKLYEKEGNEAESHRFLIISAISDARAANREIASLEDIANQLYEGTIKGKSRGDDLRRANEYISHCILCANQYKSRVRVGRLAELQQRIAQGYQEELMRQEDRASTYAVLLGAILLGLLAAMVLIIVQMRRLRRSRELLNDANRALNGKVEELETLQAQLRDANENLTGLYSNAREGAIEMSRTNLAKEKYIADIFAVCSSYIGKIDDFRKNIYRLLLAGKYEELRKLTKTPDLPQAEVKELHRTFDKIFLGIYPDFVQDFNSLLRPEERVELKRDDLLNTELRIYALVRLGLTDSTAIARFLHCSVQTVYNTRLRTRAKAAVPPREFAERVASLGKISF